MVFQRKVSRRDFLKLSAGSVAALGVELFRFPNFEKLLAAAVAELPVIWLQGGGCTGCTTSVLNSLSPKIQDILLSQVIPGNHVSLRVHPTVMAAQGDLVLKAMEDTAKRKGGYLLVVEGSVPTKDNGIYCEFGERNGHGITLLEHLTTLGSNAMAVIAIGACATHGGVPSAPPNSSGSKGVKDVLNEKGIKTTVINVPGCPPHPDWFVGTLASVLIGGLKSVELDKDGRPLAFFGHLIHDNCTRRGYFEADVFAKKFSEPTCLWLLGCKGPVTYADCPVRLWNSGTNWCVGSNGPCIGCASLEFPNGLSPLRMMAPIRESTAPTYVPPIEPPGIGLSPAAAAGIGAAAGVAAGAAGMALFARRKAKQPEQSNEES